MFLSPVRFDNKALLTSGEAPHPLKSLLSSDNQDAFVTVESERRGSVASQIVGAVK